MLNEWIDECYLSRGSVEFRVGTLRNLEGFLKEVEEEFVGVFVVWFVLVLFFFLSRSMWGDNLGLLWGGGGSGGGGKEEINSEISIG